MSKLNPNKEIEIFEFDNEELIKNIDESNRHQMRRNANANAKAKRGLKRSPTKKQVALYKKAKNDPYQDKGRKNYAYATE